MRRPVEGDGSPIPDDRPLDQTTAIPPEHELEHFWLTVLVVVLGLVVCSALVAVSIGQLP